MGWKRDLFSGELIETRESGEGRQVVFRGRLPYGDQTVLKTRCDPWDTGKDHVDRGMSIKPEEATAEKIALLNENAKRHGTGAYYTKDGECKTPTRRSRAKEMLARSHVDFGFQDNDSCYGDWAGR